MAVEHLSRWGHAHFSRRRGLHLCVLQVRGEMFVQQLLLHVSSNRLLLFGAPTPPQHGSSSVWESPTSFDMASCIIRQCMSLSLHSFYPGWWGAKLYPVLMHCQPLLQVFNSVSKLVVFRGREQSLSLCPRYCHIAVLQLVA